MMRVLMVLPIAFISHLAMAGCDVGSGSVPLLWAEPERCLSPHDSQLQAAIYEKEVAHARFFQQVIYPTEKNIAFLMRTINASAEDHPMVVTIAQNMWKGMSAGLPGPAVYDYEQAMWTIYGSGQIRGGRGGPGL